MKSECADEAGEACPQKADSRNVALMAAARVSSFPTDRFQTGVLVLAIFVVHHVNTDGIGECLSRFSSSLTSAEVDRGRR